MPDSITSDPVRYREQARIIEILHTDAMFLANFVTSLCVLHVRPSEREIRRAIQAANRIRDRHTASLERL